MLDIQTVLYVCTSSSIRLPGRQRNNYDLFISSCSTAPYTEPTHKLCTDPWAQSLRARTTSRVIGSHQKFKLLFDHLRARVGCPQMRACQFSPLHRTMNERLGLYLEYQIVY